jgi:hypothetical protein
MEDNPGEVTAEAEEHYEELANEVMTTIALTQSRGINVLTEVSC